jgi:GNAT superfamily N-acetyltransferase
MQFELTEALIDDILFSMEDQQEEYYVDTQDGVVTGEPELFDSPGKGGEAQNRYIPLPEWDSSEGFRLMERFAAGFRNPPIRDKLTAALDRGKGVFRAFKDVLNTHPEAEQLWFSFKEREMRRVVFNWYNALREDWGLSRIGCEPEETEDLVLEDFRFREPEGKDTAAAEALHALCVGEIREALFSRRDSPPELPEEAPGRVVLVAETGSGDFAGYIATAALNGTLRITALEVKPEYRGLGVGETLLVRFLKTLAGQKASDVIIDLPTGVEGFSRVLVRESFKPCMTRYWLDVKNPG